MLFHEIYSSVIWSYHGDLFQVFGNQQNAGKILIGAIWKVTCEFDEEGMKLWQYWKMDDSTLEIKVWSQTVFRMKIK